MSKNRSLGIYPDPNCASLEIRKPRISPVYQQVICSDGLQGGGHGMDRLEGEGGFLSLHALGEGVACIYCDV